jgi:hypothetical protein
LYQPILQHHQHQFLKRSFNSLGTQEALALARSSYQLGASATGCFTFGYQRTGFAIPPLNVVPWSTINDYQKFLGLSLLGIITTNNTLLPKRYEFFSSNMALRHHTS